MRHYTDNDRLQRLTNFTGSNGAVIVFTDKKPVFITNSRYKLQSQMEVDQNLFELIDPEKPEEIPKLIADRFQKKEEREEVVIDGALFSIRQAESIKEKLESLGIPLTVNLLNPLIDELNEAESSKLEQTNKKVDDSQKKA